MDPRGSRTGVLGDQVARLKVSAYDTSHNIHIYENFTFYLGKKVRRGWQ